MPEKPVSELSPAEINANYGDARSMSDADYVVAKAKMLADERTDQRAAQEARELSQLVKRYGEGHK